MRKTKGQPLTPEWSYLVPADDVGVKPVRLTISAGENERAAVARRLGILGIEEIEARLTVERAHDKRIIHVHGRFSSTVQQACVVTLEPVTNRVEEDVEGWFVDPEQAVSFAKARRDRLKLKAGIDVPMLEEYEDPEPMIDGMVDVGELVVQTLSLALPPYPHKDGVEFQAGDDGTGAEASPVRKNPFEALRHWKARKEGSED